MTKFDLIKALLDDYHSLDTEIMTYGNEYPLTTTRLGIHLISKYESNHVGDCRGKEGKEVLIVI